MKLSIIAFTLAFSLPAMAANYVIYVPAVSQVGTAEAEVYIPKFFTAHKGLAGAALVDASWKELKDALPKGMAQLEYYVSGTKADVKASKANAQNPDISDRALGAAYHTLLSAGIKEVTFNGEPVSASKFYRGVQLVVLPLHLALPPQRLSYGFVQYGKFVDTADEFYRKLTKRDAEIRNAGLEALSKGSTAVKLTLLERLNNLRLKPKKVKPALLALLKDANVKVRLTVIKRLQANRDKATLKALEAVVEGDKNNDVRISAVKILVKAGKNQFSKYLLLEKLKSTDPAVIVDAAGQLIKVNDVKLATAFLPLVKNRNPQVRQAGIKGLAHYKLFREMLSFLTDTDVHKDVREPTARILTDNASGTAQARGVAWLMVSGTEANAVHAASVAGKKRVPGVTEALGKALTRREVRVRLGAARAMGKIKDPAALEPLAAAVRTATIEAEKDVFTKMAISIISVQSLNQVIKISKSVDRTIRVLATKALAEFAKDSPNRKVIDVLKTSLKDADKTIRRAAAYALARIPSAAVVKELIAIKKDSDEQVRAQVVYAVQQSKDANANAIILDYLEDISNVVKEAAVKAIIVRRIVSAVPKIKQLVGYRHDGVRTEVIRALITLTRPAEPALFKIYGDRVSEDTVASIKIMAIDALAKYLTNPKTVTAIGAGVQDQDKSVKLHALKRLGGLKDPQAAEQIFYGLSPAQPIDVQMAALDAFAALKSPNSKTYLKQFIENTDNKKLKARALEVMKSL